MNKKKVIIVSILFNFFLLEKSICEPIQLSRDVVVSFSAEYMSRYVYRGIDQNKDRSTASVSANFSLPAGIYMGTWIAEANYGGSSKEVDLYFGINQSYKDFNFDIYYLEARYPGKNLVNVGEYNFKLVYQANESPFRIGYYFALEDTNETVGSDYKEYSIGYDFKNFNLLATYGDWDVINKTKTITASKSFQYFDVKISHIITDNSSNVADERFNTVVISKSF